MALPLVLMTHPLPQDWRSIPAGPGTLLVGPVEPSWFCPHLLEQLNEALPKGSCPCSLIRSTMPCSAAPRACALSATMPWTTDNIDVPACTRRRIPVGNTPGVLTDATADLAMTLLLSCARGIVMAATDARSGLWRAWTPTGWLGADLAGATLGIIGMGKIGRAVAERAKGFGLNIVYFKPQRNGSIESLPGMRYLPLDGLLRESDFVSLHCPLTPQTRGLIDEDGPAKNEAHRHSGQHQPRPDSRHEGPRGCPAGRLDRRRRARRH